jgi:hypothetical protein
MTELSVPSMTECAGAIGIADPENAGIATNAQAARPINIERFIGVSFAAATAAREDNATALQEFPEQAPRERLRRKNPDVVSNEVRRVSAVN